MGAYSDRLNSRRRTVPAPTAVPSAALKGKFDGNCNRTACQQPIAGRNYWNSSTRAYYCEQCADGYQGINHWSRRDSGVIICTLVQDPTDQPPFPYAEMRAHEEKRRARAV